MGLDKGIEYGKEKRRKHRGAKDIDPAYRNHGESTRGYDDRTYKYRKAEQEANEKYKDWEEDLEEEDDDWDDYPSYSEEEENWEEYKERRGDYDLKE